MTGKRKGYMTLAEHHAQMKADGTYDSPRGTPFEMRSLPPSAASAPLRAYEVLKPLPAQCGRTASWFGQWGGGTQYEFAQPIETLVQQGYLGVLE